MNRSLFTCTECLVRGHASIHSDIHTRPNWAGCWDLYDIRWARRVSPLLCPHIWLTWINCHLCPQHACPQPLCLYSLQTVVPFPFQSTDSTRDLLHDHALRPALSYSSLSAAPFLAICCLVADTSCAKTTFGAKTAWSVTISLACMFCTVNLR